MKREQEGAEKNINYVTIERRKYRKKQNERIPVQNDGKRGRRGEIFSEKREKTAGAVGQFHFVKQKGGGMSGRSVRGLPEKFPAKNA